MINMLRFELRRLLKKPSFYICAGLCLAFIVLMAVSAKMNFDSSVEYYQRYRSEWDSNYMERLKEQFDDNFSPEMMALNGFSSMGLPIVLAIFSGIFVCEDKVRGTIKNIYARGYSRTNVFFAKFIVTTGVALVSFLLTTLVSYLSGMMIFATANNVGAEMIHVKGFILLLIGKLVAIMAINAMYFMLSELLGSIGFSIAANLFLPYLISTVLYIIISIIYDFMIRERDILSDTSGYSSVMKIIEYWVLNLVYGGFNVGMKPEDYAGHLIACAVYFVIFGALGWLIIRKRQVKN